MIPRLPLTVSPYAMRAHVADTVSEAAVTSAMLAPGAVTTHAVANHSITAGKILGGAWSGVDADLLDGKSSEDFIHADGGAWTAG